MSEPIRVERHAGEEHPEWDVFVERTPGGHHLQTALWAQVKSVVGLRGVRLLLRAGDRIIGGCQLLVRRVPLVGAIAYVPRGPLVIGSDPHLIDVLFDGLGRLAAAERIVYLKVQPPTDRDDMTGVLEGRGFVATTLEAAPVATVRVELRDRTDEDLLGAMRATTRRYVRKAERNGVVVRDGIEADLPILQSLLEATAQRQGFSAYSAAYHRRMWQSFAPGGHVRLLIAEHEGIVLSCALLIAFGDSVIYKVGAWKGTTSTLRPNELLHWTAMRWARDQGHEYYDFEGIGADAAAALRAGRPLPEELSGVTYFKLGFGGMPTLFPSAYDGAYGRVVGPAVVRMAPRLERWRSLAHRAVGRER
jgi:lipid II:glycine glycyltransferase (peptidoglycan interpeptide bridge formation enzyme)